MACVGALGAALNLIPELRSLRLFGASEPSSEEPSFLRVDERVGEATVDVETRARRDLAQPERVEAPRPAAGPIATRDPSDTPPEVTTARPPVSVSDPARSLDKFFQALQRTARREPRAVTRVLYYGDSAVASDFGTGTLRRKLQERFGDSGHGFVLTANAWPQYFHNDIYRMAARGWRVSRVVGPTVHDGFYGLGGVSFNAPPGLRSLVGTARGGTFGRRASRFAVAYLEQPGGGVLKVNVDGQPRGEVDTSGDEKKPGFFELSVDDGEHLFELVTARGMTRTFGFVVERQTPGVVLDALGIVGARLRFLDKIEDAHWAAQLKWRKPNLLVFQFGANESADGFAYPMHEYNKTMKSVLLEAQRAVPESGCLVIGAMDRAKKEGARLVSVKVIPHLVKEQSSAAAEAGCAFWNTFEAMGGDGSMARWVYRGYGAGDFTHPTSVGADVLGTWIFEALMERYEVYAK